MLLQLYFRPEQHFHSQGRTETVLQAFLSGNIVLPFGKYSFKCLSSVAAITGDVQRMFPLTFIKLQPLG